METDTRRQLEALFGDLPEGMKFLVCSKRNFAGRWFEKVDDAVPYAAAEAAVSDVYVGVGLRRNAPPAGERGKADEIDGIVGLWADIDIGGPAHAKKNLPATMQDAAKLLHEILPVIPPSAEVFSGHGLQAWWLFPEPWIFSTDADRAAARVFLKKFSNTANSVARSAGLVIDPVFDLARVMRLGGTFNRKTEPAMATALLVPAPGAPVRRWDQEDLDACFVAEETVEGNPGSGTPVGQLILHPDRRPPEDALFALVTNNEKALASWNKKRPDLPDQSGSSYDFSMAVFAAQYGWTDQEMADLLVSRRRKHGEDLKATKKGVLRVDYYQRTILAARQRVANDKSAKAYDHPDAAPLVVEGQSPTEDVKAKILAKARGVFGMDIVRFVQHGEQRDARYSFVMRDGTTLDLGGANELEHPGIIRALVYTVTGRFPKMLKAPAWAAMWGDLGAVREVVVNEESGRDGRFAAMLFEYLSSKTGAITSALRSGDNWAEAVSAGDPFVRDGRIAICTTSVEGWIKSHYARKMDVRELWTILPDWGFTNATVATRIGPRKVARRYWSIPIDDLAERRGFSVPIVYAATMALPAASTSGGADATIEPQDGRQAATSGPAAATGSTGYDLPAEWQ